MKKVPEFVIIIIYLLAAILIEKYIDFIIPAHPPDPEIVTSDRY